MSTLPRHAVAQPLTGFGALFSIPVIGKNGRFLDLYAGTGAVGIEAVSRGMEHVTSVESNRDALKLLHQNLELFHIGEEIAVRSQTVQQFLSYPNQWNGPYDIVFADPPYAEASELPSLLTESRTYDLFALDSRLVIEHAAKTDLPMSLGCTQFLRQYRYGDTALSLYFRSSTVRHENRNLSRHV